MQKMKSQCNVNTSCCYMFIMNKEYDVENGDQESNCVYGNHVVFVIHSEDK